MARPVGLVALITALFVLVFGVSGAWADTGDVIEKQFDPPSAKDGFQAGTCIEDPPWPVQCSPDTPAIFYKQAAGHPPIGFTQYIVKHKEIVPNTLEETEAVPKTIRVDLPVGLTVNPQATPQCEIAVFKANEANCPAGSIVGREEVTLSVQVGGVIEFPPTSGNFLPKGAVLPPNPALNTLVPIFNLVPEFGEPARFGFKVGSAKAEVYLEGDVAWESDYHQGFTIKLPPPNPVAHTLRSRLVNFGDAGDGTYITNPTTCFDPASGVYSTILRAQGNFPDEAAVPFPDAFTPWEAALPPGVQLEGCDKVPFEPSIEVAPGTDRVDSPAAPTVTAKLPFRPDPNGLEQSHVRNADLTLPKGMGLNPSAAPGLAACTTTQFGKGTRNPVTCPAASKIGTAEVETQPLPPGSLKGDVYLGQQLSRDPLSGEMYRIFINPKSDRYGVDVRLIGNIKADPKTGQLTTTLAENPQVPFESVTLKLDPDKGLLTSPPTCGPNQTTSQMEPWARPGTFATPSSEFQLASAPNGGACPATLADRPFNLTHKAGPRNAKAGAYSPFDLRIERPDGAQEIKRVDVNLPSGMVAKLRGVKYCPEQNIEAGGSQSGTEVIAQPICPDDSFVGTAGIDAGSGPNPLHVNGNVYLAGPYKGAPVSLVFVTAAVAGPFDLGAVIVRVALNVDPETVQVHAVSDAIPDVFGGAKLDIRKIDVAIYRKKFTLNPTNCRKAQIVSDVFGGGANPLDPAAWFESNLASKFRATKCGKLKFRPRFSARILGGESQTHRAANPKFRAVLDARKGDANVRRASFILPRATILDQSHIRTICTRPQLEARECPKKAIYGHAKATSPLIKGALKGPVYLISSKNLLPDLLADLRGQVDVRLRGVISSENARLKTVFRRVPDVAVNKFTLTMRGGDRGLLVNSQDLCDRTRAGFLNLKAQNGDRVKKNLRLNIPACG
ncbi:MAG TPA: hypothetical protein VNP96_11355 [Solirubrobacterales bacterium]|nr:hypothetical protein [Solirubrobacterales bacterium]